MKKRGFTLIEVVTSLGLFSIIATLCVGWYVQLAVFEGKIEQRQQVALTSLTAYQQLEDFFSCVVEERAHRPLFQTSYDPECGASLVMHVDLGVQASPEFSGKVVGKLFHDPQEKELKLTVWPLPIEKMMPTVSRTLILLEDVEDIEFSYFHPQDYSKAVHPKDIGDTHPLEGWQKEWKASYEKLPAQVKLTVSQKKRELPMQFDLGAPIAYGGFI